MVKLITPNFLFKKPSALLSGMLFLACGLVGAAEPTRLAGGVWAPAGSAQTLEFDPAAAQVMISNKVVELKPQVYLRGYTLRAERWLDRDRYLANVESDEKVNAPADSDMRIVLVDIRDGTVKDTLRRGRLLCFDEAGNIYTQISSKSENKTRYFVGPLEGPVRETQIHDDEVFGFELHACMTVPLLRKTPEGREELKKIARPGWGFKWSQPKVLRHGFGKLMTYEAEARNWNDPQLANNPQAQALARQPFTAGMKVARGIYALSYTPPSGKTVDIVLNPGEPISLPQNSETQYEWMGYYYAEDAYFLPMFSSGLAPFGVPSAVANLPHFARLLYRDGQVRLFSPPKVLWDDFVARRAGLSGFYSAAGIIWRQTFGPERRRVYYLQKGQELRRIEGMPNRWYVMPDGCRLHLSEIDEQRTRYDETTGKSYPYTLDKYMIANLCQGETP